MVDFDFYLNIYLGNTIPEKCFAAMAKRAQAYFEWIQFNLRVQSTGAVSEKMALCAMAEEVYTDARSKNIKAADIGNVSVSYAEPSGSLLGKLVKSAGIYLDIYRGVS